MTKAQHLVRKLLKERDWGPTRLAAELGVREYTVLRWMSGVSEPHRREQDRMREMLRNGGAEAES